MKIVLGIDPGLKGALVVLGPEVLITEPMPVIGSEIDRPALFKLFAGWRDLVEFAVLELSHMRPGQSTQSVFTFGRQVGTLEMALVATGISYVTVPPRVWTRKLHAGLPADMGPKDKSRLAVMQRFPKVDASALRVGRNQKPHEGIVDALLLASYGQEL